jgi:hypothetical protein
MIVSNVSSAPSRSLSGALGSAAIGHASECVFSIDMTLWTTSCLHKGEVPDLADAILVFVLSACEFSTSMLPLSVLPSYGSWLKLTYRRKKECTFCKTPTPSLLFSRSPATPFPAEHHVLPPAPPDVIAAAQANADKLPKGKRWDEGLILPGTLELSRFDFADEKLGVAFEDEAMVRDCFHFLP